MKKRISNLPVETVSAYAVKFDELDNNKYNYNWKKFRNCSARITEYGSGYALMSYATIVAIFDRANKTVFARGRYSATTYQHVNKFAHDCGAVKTENLELVNWY